MLSGFGYAKVTDGARNARQQRIVCLGISIINKLSDYACHRHGNGLKTKGYFRQIVAMCKDAGAERPELEYARKMAN